MINDLLKRCFDIVLSVVGILLLWPFMLAIAVVILAGSGPPVLYRGLRTGRYGHPFRMLKFRTMIVGAEAVGGSSTAQDDPRITRYGSFLRRFKLDELPQLFNVIKGDMSIVGPRPEVAEYTDMYDEEEKLILLVRPGITDFSSIKFRDLNAILAQSGDPDRYYRDVIRPQKNRLRLDYAMHNNIWLDIKIVVMTLRAMAQKPQQRNGSWST